MRTRIIIIVALVAAFLLPLPASADDYDPQSVEACLANHPGYVDMQHTTPGQDAVCVPWGYTPTAEPGDRYFMGANSQPSVIVPPGTPQIVMTGPDTWYTQVLTYYPDGTVTTEPYVQGDPLQDPFRLLPKAPTDLSAVLLDTGTASTAAYVTTASGPVALVRHAKVAGARRYVTRCGTNVVRSRYLRVRIHAHAGTVCRVRAVNAVGTSHWSKRVVVRKASATRSA